MDVTSARKALFRFFTALLILTCSACGTAIVMVPKDIGSRGLLVGEVCTLDGGLDLYGDPFINGTLYTAGMRGGYFTIPMAPGDYRLDLLHQVQTSNSAFTLFRNYPINVPFKIVPKQATSIGLLFIDGVRQSTRPGVTAAGALATPYRIIPVNNADEMGNLLRDARPELYSTLFKDQPVTYFSAGADPATLEQIRFTIAQAKLEESIRRGSEPSAYLTGCAGTVGRMVPGRNGRTALSILPTSTLADLSSCKATGDRMACLISRTEYLSIADGKVTHERVPANIKANTLQAVSKDRLVIVDDSMNVYTSGDNGLHWNEYADSAFPAPLGLDFRADPKNRFKVEAGDAHFYVFGTALDANHTRLLQGDYQTGSLRDLNLPKAAYLKTVRETKKGVFVSPSPNMISKARVYFLPTGSSTWETRETPESDCYDIAFPDDSGMNLQVICWGDNDVWNSADGGVTWQRVFRQNSLFAEP